MPCLYFPVLLLKCFQLVYEVDELLAEAMGAKGPCVSLILPQANLDLFIRQLWGYKQGKQNWKDF